MAHVHHTFLYLDNLVVVYVVQSVGSIPSSNNWGVGQEVGAMDPILKVKLEHFSCQKKVFPLDIVSFVFPRIHMSHMLGDSGDKEKCLFTFAKSTASSMSP